MIVFSEKMEWPQDPPDWFPVDVAVPEGYRKDARKQAYIQIKGSDTAREREAYLEAYKRDCKNHVEQQLRAMALPSSDEEESDSDSSEHVRLAERKRRRLEEEGIPRRKQNVNNEKKKVTIDSKVEEAVAEHMEVFATEELTLLQKKRVVRKLMLELKKTDKK